jgi:hypothetical protein
MVFLLLLCLGKIQVNNTNNKKTIVIGLILIFRKILTSNTQY